MVYSFKDNEHIVTPYGKMLNPSSVIHHFQGFHKLSKSAEMILSISHSFSPRVSTMGSTSAMALLSTTSLFSNAFAFLSKLIQIIEFTSFMELFNVEFDQSMGGLLRGIAESTELNLLQIPLD